jgi:hypothetical protein
MAQEYKETYRASVEIVLPDGDELKKRLETYEKLARETAEQIEKIFKDIEIKSFGIDPFRAFGEEIRGLNIGPLGGVSKITKAQVDDLADAIARLSERTDMDLTEIAESFSNLSEKIAEGARMSPDMIDRAIGDGLRHILGLTDEVTDGVYNMWEDLRVRLLEKSPVPELVDGVDYYMSKMAGQTGARFEELKDKLLLSMKELVKQSGRPLEELNQEWNKSLSAMFRAGQLRGNEFRYLSNAVYDVVQTYEQLGEEAREQASAGIPMLDVVRQTGVKYDDLLDKIEAGTTKLNKAGNVTSASFRRIQEEMFKVDRTFNEMTSYAEQFNDLMVRATKQTRGFSEGFSLIRGGDVLLGLRTAIAGTGEATTKTAKSIDFLRRTMGKLRDTTTAEEAALVANLEAFQQRDIAARNAVNRLKDYGKRLGVAKSSLDQFTESMRVQLNATRRQTQAAIANQEITEHGIAEMRNSVTVMREQIAVLKEHAKAQIGDHKEYEMLIKRMEDFADQTEREITITVARNKQVKKSREEREKENKELGEHSNVLQRVVKSLGIFKRGSDDAESAVRRLALGISGVTIPLDRLSSVVDLTNRTIFKFVALFSTVNTGFELIREGIRRTTESMRVFKNEFLGFGVINDFMSQLTTGVVEFAAESRQAQFAVKFMGEQLAIATGRDSQLAVEGLVQKMEQLQEQGVGIRESSELVKRALTTGFVIGPIGEATEEVLKLDTSLEQLIIAYNNQEIGLETVARAAQNWSTVMGGSSSEIADKFLQASTRMKTEILETNGLAKNASVLWQEYVDALNRLNPEAELTVKNLTDEQKQAATLLGILKQTLPAAGAYEQAMDGMGDSVDTTGKLIGSMSRYVDNAKLALGDVFLPVLRQLLENLKVFLKRVTEIAQSPAMQRLGEAFTKLAANLKLVNPVITFMMDNFEEFAGSIYTLVNAIADLAGGDTQSAIQGFRDFFLDAIAGIAIVLDKTVKKALVWGWNLVVNLANGIIDAAQSILVSAMNLVGNIIGLFFAPGSPPKEGPLKNIDQWGAGLTETLAKGMETAAPSAFASVSETIGNAVSGALGGSFRTLEVTSLRTIRDAVSQIRGIFQSMVSAGTMEDTDVAPGLMEVRDLMVQLANEFENTGIISEDILSAIGDRLGDAGDDMEKYIRLQFELQQAQDELKDIDEEIAAAEAAGFVPAELRKRKKDAEERIDSLQEQFDLQRELLSWQKESNDLVQQQVDLLKRIADQNEKASLAAAKGEQDQWQAFLDRYNEELAALETKKALGLITEEEYMQGRLRLEQQYIDNAIRLNQPLTEERIRAFKELRDQVEALRGGAGGAGGIDAEDILGTDGKSMGDILDPLLATVQDRVDETKAKLGGVSEEFANMRDSIESMLYKIGYVIEAVFSGDFERVLSFIKWKFGVDFETIGDTIVEKIKGAFENVTDKVGGWLEPITSKIKAAFDEVGQYIPAIIGGGIAAALIAPKVKGGLTGLNFGNLFAPITDKLGILIRPITTLARTLLGPLLSGFKILATTMVGILGPVGSVAVAVGLLVGGFILFKDEIEGVAEAISGALGWRLETLGAIVKRVFNLVSDIVINGVKAFQRFIDTVTEGESVNRFLDRLYGLARIVSVVLGAVATAVLFLAEKLLYLISDALEPAAEVLGWLFRSLLDIATVIMNTVVGPVEVLFRLFTEGPESAIEALGKLFGDTMRLIPAIGAMVAAWKFGLPTPLSLIPKALEGIRGGLTITQVALSEFKDVAIAGFGAIKTLILNMGTAVRTFTSGPMAALRGGWGSLTSFLSSSTLLTGGVILAAVAAWGVAIAKFKEAFDKAAEGAEKSKAAIRDWSTEAQDMKDSGEDASEIVEEFAGRMNEARDIFDQAGPLTDIFGHGKDIEIFNEGAEEMNEVLLGITGTYDEYLARVQQYNELAEVEEMRIQALTEEAYKLRLAWMQTSGVQEKGAFILDRLAQGNNWLGAAIRKSRIEQEKQADIQEELARGAAASDVAMLNSARRQTELAQASRQAAQDQEALRVAMEDVMRSGLTMDTSQVTSAVQGRKQAYQDYLTERNNLIDQYNQERLTLEQQGNVDSLAALQTKHTEELAEIDRRYAEEDAKRKAEIGRALLDLNDRIMQEKLMVEGQTSEQLAAIESFHRGRAEQIGTLYDVDVEQRYANKQAEILRAYTVTSDKIEEDTGTTIENLLTTFDKLNEEGYGALTEQQKRWVAAAALSNAEYLTDVNATKDEVVGALSLIPQHFHEQILDMLEEGANIEDLVEAFGGLNRLIETDINIKTSMSDEDRERFQFTSPQMKIHKAIEALVEYTAENPVIVQFEMTEGVAEYLEEAASGMEDLSETADKTGRDLRTILRTIKDLFWKLHDEVVGPAGAMTRMVSLILQKLQSLTASYGILGQLSSEITRIFSEMGSKAALQFGLGVSKIYAYLEELFSKKKSISWLGGREGLLETAFWAGVDLMIELANGIVYGITYITAALAKVQAAIDENWPTPPNRRSGASIDLPPTGTIPGNGRVIGVEGGITRIIHIDKFYADFPNVRDGRDAIGIWRDLERQVENSRLAALSGV